MIVFVSKWVKNIELYRPLRIIIYGHGNWEE